MNINDVGRYLSAERPQCHFLQIDVYLPADDLSLVRRWPGSYEHAYKFLDVDWWGRINENFYGSCAVGVNGVGWETGIFLVHREVPGLWYSPYDVTTWDNDRKYLAIKRAWEDDIRPLVIYTRTTIDSPIRWSEPTIRRVNTYFGFGAEIDAILFTNLCHQEF